MTIPKELLDQLLQHCDDPQDLLAQGGFLHQLTGRLVERALEGEMTDHLGYDKHAAEGKGSGNSRNGHSPKTLKSEHGDVEVRVPRDRAGAFEPLLVPKHERRLPALDDKILALYARGMTTRDIQGHLEELYHTAISPTLVSNVTAAVLDEVAAWQNRPLDAVYPILYLDALFRPAEAGGSRSATRATSARRRSTSRSASTSTVRRSFSGSGSLRPRVRASGSAC